MNERAHEQLLHDQLLYEQLLKEVTYHFSRSSGKGGQNVNKVETKVTLVFNVDTSHVLDSSAKELIKSVLKNKIDKAGEIQVTAHEERHQHANRVIAEKKFIKLIKEALTPKKKRVRTRPSMASRVERLGTKKKHGEKKHARKKIVAIDG